VNTIPCIFGRDHHDLERGSWGAALPERNYNPNTMVSSGYVCSRCHVEFQSNNVVRDAPVEHALTALRIAGSVSTLAPFAVVDPARCQDPNDVGGARKALVPLGDLAVHRAWLDGFAAGRSIK
jgi:hypothetical protein